MCNLCRLKVARKPLALKAPLDRGWLRINKIIDSFHLRNYINPECQTSFSPQKLKEIHPDANTQFCLDGKILEYCLCYEQNLSFILFTLYGKKAKQLYSKMLR